MTSNEPQLLLYPNPATDRLNVEISGVEFTSGHFVISDISGKFIIKGKIESETDQINLSLLKPGFYILRVDVSEIVLSKPIIISN